MTIMGCGLEVTGECRGVVLQMGPSGSGKTTLLDVLAGRKTAGKTSGSILFAGVRPTSMFLRRYTGYVEQFGGSPLPHALSLRHLLQQRLHVARPDDVEHPPCLLEDAGLPSEPCKRLAEASKLPVPHVCPADRVAPLAQVKSAHMRSRRLTVMVAAADTLVDVLTVEEMLMYTAELKRPVKEQYSSKKAAVDALINDLGLETCRNVRIGNSMARGISGGQVGPSSSLMNSFIVRTDCAWDVVPVLARHESTLVYLQCQPWAGPRKNSSCCSM